MRDLLEQYPNNLRARGFLYYAIGKECEDLQDWVGAFEAFQQGPQRDAKPSSSTRRQKWLCLSSFARASTRRG
ncbi:MAG: hypothetical protein CM15mP74_36000 [Halieaceae bacterium]|nr:MAG: hypothetical protein CM15mP74_36000 [Halieaceae bacterium]